MIWVIIGILVLVFMSIFAKFAEKEANRITVEVDFRLQGLEASANSLKHLLDENDDAVVKDERLAFRYHARAREVADSQSGMWKLVSKVTNRRR